MISLTFVRSNDKSRMLFSVLTVGDVAGDVLHIPWAQDLSLVSFRGFFEVQMDARVFPVEQSAVWKPLKICFKIVCKEEEFLSISLSSILCWFDHNVALQRLPYLCPSMSSLQACFCINTRFSIGMWNSCCGKRNTSFDFFFCMDLDLYHMIFTPHSGDGTKNNTKTMKMHCW